MSKTLKLIVCCLLLTQPVFSQWKAISGTVHGGEDLAFTDDSTGFVVGGDFINSLWKGTIYKSKDGGMLWNKLHFDTLSRFTSVFFLSDKTGYAISDVGQLIKTNDAGLSWVYISNSFKKNLNFRNIKFKNEQEGYLVTESGLYKTLDGGYTWGAEQHVFNVNISNLTILNNTVFLIGCRYSQYGDMSGPPEERRIFKSTENVDSWTTLDIKTTQDCYMDIDFPDEKHGFAGGYSGIINKTQDGGMTWNEVKLDNKYGIYQIRFTDSLNGFASGRARVLDNSYRFILTTNDGGDTWTEDLALTNNGTVFLSFPSPNVGYALVGNTIYKKDTRILNGKTNNQTSYFKIHPNPTTGYFHIESTDDSFKPKAHLVNSYGNTIKELNLEDGYFDTIGLSSGLYYIKIQVDTTGSSFHKLIIE